MTRQGGDGAKAKQQMNTECSSPRKLLCEVKIEILYIFAALSALYYIPHNTTRALNIVLITQERNLHPTEKYAELYNVFVFLFIFFCLFYFIIKEVTRYFIFHHRLIYKINTSRRLRESMQI